MVFPKEKRVVDHSTSQRLKYRPRESQEKNLIMHCGQLKLLLAETHFLTQWSSANDIVIYIGGASGMHLPTLSR